MSKYPHPWVASSAYESRPVIHGMSRLPRRVQQTSNETLILSSSRCTNSPTLRCGYMNRRTFDIELRSARQIQVQVSSPMITETTHHTQRREATASRAARILSLAILLMQCSNVLSDIRNHVRRSLRHFHYIWALTYSLPMDVYLLHRAGFLPRA